MASINMTTINEISTNKAEAYMFYTHPYFLGLSMGIITLWGLYAGIFSIFVDKTKYAHKFHWFTVVFSLFTAIGIHVPFIVIYFTTAKQGLLSMYWTFLWYWSESCIKNTANEGYKIEYWLYWYIYTCMVFNLLMNFVFYVVSKWKPLPTNIDYCSDRHAFVIVAHNSSYKLKLSIPAILKFAKPHQIFVADNGSNEEEIMKTDSLCKELSDNYYVRNLNEIDNTPIRVAHIKYGNKTLAQYATIFELELRYSLGISSMDIITIIDDDVVIPEAFPSSSIEKQFDDQSIIALAYPLSAENANSSICARFQDIEYLGGDEMRYIQYLLGTQLFASGAIATWKVTQLLRVLERHCTTFNGEDLEMGYIVHNICDYRTAELSADGPVRIGFVYDCIIPTIVPFCSIHWYDLIPRKIQKCVSFKRCECGEHSLFNQRLRSWDPACHQYFFKFIKIIMSPNGLKYPPKIFVRIVCLWKITSLIREYLLVVGIFVSFCQIDSIDGFSKLMVFYGDSIFVNWAFGILCTAMQSWSMGRINLTFSPDIVFCYPILFEIPYALVVRVISSIYSLCYYIFVSPFPKTVSQQIADDQDKRNILHSAWKSPATTNLTFDPWFDDPEYLRTTINMQRNSNNILSPGYVVRSPDCIVRTPVMYPFSPDV